MSLFLSLVYSIVHAQSLEICYNYGCHTSAHVTFHAYQLAIIQTLFEANSTPAQERLHIAYAIGLMETFVGEQTPTWRDKGENYQDSEVEGRMDCIDHSHNTLAYLSLLAEHGWLKFHEVVGKVKRAPWLLDDHWAVQITEKTSQIPYVVDSWFFDNGYPAVVLPLHDWEQGAHP